MCSVQKDLYIFEDGLDGISSTNMPTELMIRDEIAHEALLIRLLSGTLKVTYPVHGEYSELLQLTNYAIPGRDNNTTFKKKIIQDFFSLNHYRQSEASVYKGYKQD